jgi:ribosomal protein L37AE/L43A
MHFSDLLEKVKLDYPELVFQESNHFSWDPNSNTIFYKNSKIESKETALSIKRSNQLLHELAHAKLNHQAYLSDASLLKIESEAWNLAKDLAEKYSIKFSEKEQEKSLSSYVNWASSRSQCPKCKKNGLQNLQTEFICPSCNHKWKVGKSRFKRTYRQS